jgi:hypothetical protein
MAGQDSGPAPVKPDAPTAGPDTGVTVAYSASGSPPASATGAGPNPGALPDTGVTGPAGAGQSLPEPGRTTPGLVAAVDPGYAWPPAGPDTG